MLAAIAVTTISLPVPIAATAFVTTIFMPAIFMPAVVLRPGRAAVGRGWNKRGQRQTEQACRQ
jgi:hypothetical protein